MQITVKCTISLSPLMLLVNYLLRALLVFNV